MKYEPGNQSEFKKTGLASVQIFCLRQTPRRGILTDKLQKIEELNRTFRGSSSEYATRVKAILGPTAEKVYGKKIKAGHEFSVHLMQYDTPAIIADILGVQIPADWRGRAYKEIYK